MRMHASVPQRAVSDPDRSLDAYGTGFGPAGKFKEGLLYWLGRKFLGVSYDVRLEQVHPLVESRRFAIAELTTWQGQLLGPRFGCQEEFLETGLRSTRQPVPLFDGHQHSGRYATFRDDLRSFGHARLQELAEPRLRVLHLAVNGNRKLRTCGN